MEDNLVEYRNPGIAMPVVDPLTAVLRQGARKLLQQAVEDEVVAYEIELTVRKAARNAVRCMLWLGVIP